MVVPIDGGKILQGFNAMLDGWWAAADMTVDSDGNSNLIMKSRRPSEEVYVAGASLTGVPLHILHRDDGYNYELYVNGRLLINATQNRHPDDAEEIAAEFKKK